MKKLLLLALVLCFTGLPGAAQPSADDGVAVFSYNADQLAALFAGKTRKEVLYTVNTVSSLDTTVKSTSGKEYALVRYGKTNDDFRVFLFESNSPQKLVAVTDTVKGVLALDEKYGITINLPEKDFTAQAPQTYLTTITNVATNQIYTAYQSGNKYLVFQNGALKHTFDSHEYAAFIATVSAANSSYQAEQARLQTQLEQERLAAQQQTNNQRTVVRSSSSYIVPTILGTALVGGLVWNGIYWHNHRPHHHAQPGPGPTPHRPGYLPPMRPSGSPAGTPLIRDVDGRYMNRR